MMEPKDLNIGDKVYRYVAFGGIFTYIVKGIHVYQDTTQYHVVCKSCTGHEPCELLIGYNGRDLQFFSCLNNRGDDYDEDNQVYWHTDYTYPFCTTVEEAKIGLIRANIEACSKDIEDRQAAINKRKKDLEKYKQDLLDTELLLKELKKGEE